MKIESKQLIEDGFIIFRNIVPSDQLRSLRTSFEDMVERQKEIWAQTRTPSEPPGGQWELSDQPRLNFQDLVNSSTANTIRFCLHENTMEASRQIMAAETAGHTGFMLMCNPINDRGPAAWHRDIHPIDQAPLSGLQNDLLNNAPGYLQWNIPLYDDDVLWVVPKSHRRINSEKENHQLKSDPKKPLSGGIKVNLKAGDGVVYTNTILHWGSNYSSRLRRTIHLGYRSYGGPIFPYVNRTFRDLKFTTCLSPKEQNVFKNIKDYYDRETNLIETIFRAVIARNEDTFYENLARLHPGNTGRLVSVILLSKIVYKMKFNTHPHRLYYGSDISHDEDLKPRFTKNELLVLWQRFGFIDSKLKSDFEQYVPGFQSGPMEYLFEEMPSNLTLESFVASWR